MIIHSIALWFEDGDIQRTNAHAPTTVSTAVHCAVRTLIDKNNYSSCRFTQNKSTRMRNIEINSNNWIINSEALWLPIELPTIYRTFEGIWSFSIEIIVVECTRSTHVLYFLKINQRCFQLTLDQRIEAMILRFNETQYNQFTSHYLNWMQE